MEKFKKERGPAYLTTGVWVFVLSLIAAVITLLIMFIPTILAMFGGAVAIGLVALISLIVGFIILGWVFISLYHRR